MTKEELVKLMAQIIEGLEVPFSIRRQMLGTAGEAWLKIYSGLNLFGYASSEDIEKKLTEILK